MWSFHAAATVAGIPIKSVYPAYGGKLVGQYLNRIVWPREMDVPADYGRSKFVLQNVIDKPFMV